MKQRVLRAAVFLFVILAARANAGEGPDIRGLLSKTKHRIFEARIAGVAFRPGPLTTLGNSGDAELINAVSYWLRTGNEYEVRLGARLSSTDDILKLKFEKKYDFRNIEPEVWANIAIAKAVSGDYRGGAEMLEAGALLYLHFDRKTIDAAFRMRSDAVTVRIQQAHTDDDVRTLLDALATVPAPAPRALGPVAEAHFNRGLILEKLGLNQTAIASYRQSLLQAGDESWNEETNRRISQISQPSREDRWQEAHAQLLAASRSGTSRRCVTSFASFPTSRK
ncbi:MAG TPA: tetratricopeptide repeat protein [Thermoanaerobaculia bacterium]|jgi:hypothetical protein|nr:tetratricopeptide repeat protein [Thermoanaerobaculia bacterium]